MNFMYHTQCTITEYLIGGEIKKIACVRDERIILPEIERERKRFPTDLKLYGSSYTCRHFKNVLGSNGNRPEPNCPLVGFQNSSTTRLNSGRLGFSHLGYPEVKRVSS